MQVSDNCFHFLRFVFAFIVVVGHFIVISDSEQIQYLYPYFNTYYAVTGFFVISGYLITQSYLTTHNILTYLTKRARRLLPAYITVVCSCAVLLVFLSSYSPIEYFTHPLWRKYLVANLAFLNFVQPCLPGVFNSDFFDCSVNPAMWTIKIEVGFYLILPFILWGLQKMGHRWFGLLIIYVCSIAYKVILTMLGGGIGQEGPNMFIFLARQLPGFMSYFSIGIAIQLYKNIFLKYKNKLLIPALIVAIIERTVGVEYFFPFAYAIIILWCAQSFTSLHNFGKIGDLSYGIYIYHAPILKIILSLGILQIGNIYTIFAIYILLVFTIGAISWHGMEKHFLKRNKKVLS